MGLIARALEASGIATTSLTSAWTITAAVNPPRAVYTDFPLGHTAGPPDAPDVQLDIARSALGLLDTADEPGTIVPLDHAWPEPWRDAARALTDHRTPRHDTPQYQSVADRDLAVGRHGDAASCPVC